MAYIGNAPAEAYTNTVKDTFSGNGSTVAFTLSLPSTTNNVRVVVENVIQDPTVAYSVSGTTLTFTSAPPSGTDNIYAVHLGPAVQTVQPPTELSGNFTLTGDLTQTGDYTLTGAATVSGNLTVDTNTLFVDATNNQVGVGTTSVSGILSVVGSMYAGPGSVSGVAYGFYPSSTYGNTGMFSPAANTVAFATSGGERARIDASGNLLVGTTVANGNGVTISGTQGNNFWASKTTSTAGYNQLTFSNPNGIVGFIQTGGSSTIYSTSSDYRLKENVVPLAGAADRLMQIPVCRFNFIADPDTTVDGFLAHEVQAFVPECVTGLKDQVETVEVTDEDGNVIGTEERPVYQGIDQSKLVPLLTAALQEALQKIDALEARIVSLEGGAA